MQLKEWLGTDDTNLKKSLQTGIPMDSTDNQLASWILYARQVNPAIQACIKGDSNAGFETVEKLLDILQEKNVNRFSLITSLEEARINPEDIQP
jgi:biopolymer transport protein ExbD